MNLTNFINGSSHQELKDFAAYLTGAIRGLAASCETYEKEDIDISSVKKAVVDAYEFTKNEQKK